MTNIQRKTAERVRAAHVRGEWYRAAGNGERVTLASLKRAGVLERRAHRGKDGEPDAAYEYRLEPRFARAIGARFGPETREVAP